MGGNEGKEGEEGKRGQAGGSGEPRETRETRALPAGRAHGGAGGGIADVLAGDGTVPRPPGDRRGVPGAARTLAGVALPACPELDLLLARATARVRARRAASGVLLALGLSGVVALALELLRTIHSATTEAPYGHAVALGAGAAVAVAGAVLSLGARWSRVDEESVARDADRRLALPDTAATALALVRGRVASPLATHVLADARPALAASLAGVPAAWSLDGTGRKAARGLWTWAVVTWAAAILLLLADLLHWFDFGVGLLGRHAGRDTGLVAQARPDVPRRTPGSRGGARGGDEERPVASDPARPDEAGPDAAPPPDPPPRVPPDEAEEPDVRARARPSKDGFRESEPVHVSVTATPTREIANSLALRVTVELDGRAASVRGDLTLGPAAPLGAGEIVDLRRLPALAGGLSPGEHTVRARLTAPDGREFVSEPAKFRIESDGDGGSGGRGDPPPTPNSPPPRPDPEAPPDAPPPRPSPESPDRSPPGPGGPEPPPPPDVPVAFDPKVVVPLFGEGDEVAKKGLSVVLEPGGGPDAGPPQHVPVAGAVEDAAKRAERQVDRGAVRTSDRDLVRRYFEALRDALR